MAPVEAATPAHRVDDAGRQGNATLGSSQISDTANSQPIQAESTALGGISISAARILCFKPFEKNTLRGFFDIELASGLILRGCMLHEKNGRRWVGLPAKPYGAQSWAAIVDFRDKRTAARFQELATAAAVAAYERGGQ
jgi:hypothetical protein